MHYPKPQGFWPCWVLLACLLAPLGLKSPPAPRWREPDTPGEWPPWACPPWQKGALSWSACGALGRMPPWRMPDSPGRRVFFFPRPLGRRGECLTALAEGRSFLRVLRVALENAGQTWQKGAVFSTPSRSHGVQWCPWAHPSRHRRRAGPAHASPGQLSGQWLPAIVLSQGTWHSGRIDPAVQLRAMRHSRAWGATKTTCSVVALTVSTSCQPR